MANKDSSIHFDRPGARVAGNWSVDNFQERKVGAEGLKGTADLRIESERRSVVFPEMFVKQLSSGKEADEQERKWKIIASREVPTYSLFKIAKNEHGDFFAVTEQLGSSGDWVVSVNNGDILNRPDFRQVIKSIPESVLRQLAQDLIQVCINLSRVDSDGNFFYMSNTALMFVFNPDNPVKIVPDVTDLGRDILLKNMSTVSNDLSPEVVEEKAWKYNFKNAAEAFQMIFNKDITRLVPELNKVG